MSRKGVPRQSRRAMTLLPLLHNPARGTPIGGGGAPGCRPAARWPDDVNDVNDGDVARDRPETRTPAVAVLRVTA